MLLKKKSIILIPDKLYFTTVTSAKFMWYAYAWISDHVTHYWKEPGMSLPWESMCERLKGGSSSASETYSSTDLKNVRDGMNYLGQDSQ
jgi:hypothetical protein